MAKKQKRRCIAYLSTGDPCKNISVKEAGQLKCIREYALAHDLDITDIYHRGGMGSFEVRKQFQMIADQIRKRKAEAVVVVKMSLVADNMEDAYSKLGIIAGAGGCVYSVNEGELSLNLHMDIRKDA